MQFTSVKYFTQLPTPAYTSTAILSYTCNRKLSTIVAAALFITQHHKFYGKKTWKFIQKHFLFLYLTFVGSTLFMGFMLLNLQCNIHISFYSFNFRFHRFSAISLRVFHGVWDLLPLSFTLQF